MTTKCEFNSFARALRHSCLVNLAVKIRMHVVRIVFKDEYSMFHHMGNYFTFLSIESFQFYYRTNTNVCVFCLSVVEVDANLLDFS